MQIQNRKLAKGPCRIHSLGQEESGSGSGGETLADAEEDRFLTLEGVRFTRKALL